MHYHDLEFGCCGLRYEDYMAYAPEKIRVGLSGHINVFTVTAVMASSFRKAHISRNITVFELVELNGRHHTINLDYVEYILTA